MRRLLLLQPLHQRRPVAHQRLVRHLDLRIAPSSRPAVSRTRRAATSFASTRSTRPGSSPPGRASSRRTRLLVISSPRRAGPCAAGCAAPSPAPRGSGCCRTHRRCGPAPAARRRRARRPRQVTRLRSRCSHSLSSVNCSSGSPAGSPRMSWSSESTTPASNFSPTSSAGCSIASRSSLGAQRRHWHPACLKSA